MLDRNGYTQGPYRLVALASNFDSRTPAFGIAYGSAGNRLAVVDGDGSSSLNNRANATLLAAAPDMLDALKEAREAVRELCEGQDAGNECWAILARVSAAISKAEVA